ncbi:MAG: DNA repair protein RadC [Christensenellaceae bacterium]|jgi:DNA repair protein RadC|nr:DNA repair protein RadC [Christensenellaceae bacterium]
MRIVDIQSNQDMPREKLNKKGAASLTDVELLQALIGSGVKGSNVKQIAKKLSSMIDDVGIENLTIADVKAIKGIGDAKSTIVFAALEYWRRKFEKQTRPIIDSSEKAAEQLAFIKDKKQEHFILLTLDGARRLIRAHTISIGTLTSTPVHPREVFAPAIDDRANSIIIGHYHPSGSLTVGNKDREVTRRIKDAGELLGIKLDEHIIIASNEFVSAL